MTTRTEPLSFGFSLVWTQTNSVSFTGVSHSIIGSQSPPSVIDHCSPSQIVLSPARCCRGRKKKENHEGASVSRSLDSISNSLDRSLSLFLSIGLFLSLSLFRFGLAEGEESSSRYQALAEVEHEEEGSLSEEEGAPFSNPILVLYFSFPKISTTLLFN